MPPEIVINGKKKYLKAIPGLTVNWKNDYVWHEGTYYEIEDIPEPNKDWEIIEYRCSFLGNDNIKFIKGDNKFWANMNGETFPYEEEALKHESNNLKIHSVRRLSDNQVFSIGDNVYYYAYPQRVWEIDNFFIRQDNKCLARSKDSGIVEVVGGTLKKAKPPLFQFKTSDGKDIFEGDDYWFVVTSNFPVLAEYGRSWEPLRHIAERQNSGIKSALGHIQFSTEQAAKEYILYNKPALSLRDVVEVFRDSQFREHVGYKMQSIEKLKQIIQERG